MSACPPFSGTNSRRWRNCTNDQSQSKWIIGLSLCLSSGLLLYWTKRGLFHEIMVSAIPQIKIQLHFPKWVPMLFPIKVKVSHHTRVTSWHFVLWYHCFVGQRYHYCTYLKCLLCLVKYAMFSKKYISHLQKRKKKVFPKI